jgi:hypothetical protein
VTEFAGVRVIGWQQSLHPTCPRRTDKRAQPTLLTARQQDSNLFLQLHVNASASVKHSCGGRRASNMRNDKVNQQREVACALSRARLHLDGGPHLSASTPASVWCGMQ